VDTGAVHYALAREGTLAYVQGEAPIVEHALAWVDLKGKIQPLALPKRNYYEPALSPDGKRLAVVIAGTQNDDIWVLDLARESLTRLTFGPASARSPVWTPDGTRVAYSAERDGRLGIIWKPADGSGPEERLTSSLAIQAPESFSPDGKLLVFTQNDSSQRGDIMVLPLEGDRKPRPFLTTPFDEHLARISPDGRWLAYSSNESGSEELYVQTFPGPGGKWQISRGGTGAAYAVWSRDGRQLFFRNGGGTLSRVDVTTQPSFSVSSPKDLFPFTFGGFRPSARSMFDLAPDAQRLLMIPGSEKEGARNQLNVVLRWADELKRHAANGSR
jgi:Tol biopolymer transport system component